MNDPVTPFEPRSAYPELHALAVAMRPDWNATELRDAMTAVHLAGWAWRDVFREVSRLVWARDETPATLRNSARKPGPAVPAPFNPNLRAALLEDLASRRATGPHQVIADGNPAPHRAP